MQNKLDSLDYRLLAQLDRNCRRSNVELAETLKTSRQTLEYRCKRLQDIGVLTGFHTAFNPTRLGLRLFKMHFKLRQVSEEKERLLNRLRATERVYWMGECSGSADLIVGICYRSSAELFELTNNIVSEFNHIIVEEKGHLVVDILQFPKMYLTGERSAPREYCGAHLNRELDELEEKLLEQLAEDARIPLSQLAMKLRSTPATIKSKMSELEEAGIIVQYRISVDLQKLGYELYKAVLRLDRYSSARQTEVLAYISTVTNVQYFLRNIWEIELELVVRNYQEFSEIIDGLRMKFPDLVRTVDSILMVSDEWLGTVFRNAERDEQLESVS